MGSSRAGRSAWRTVPCFRASSSLSPAGCTGAPWRRSTTSSTKRYACWYIAFAVCCSSWTSYTHCWIRVVCCTTPRCDDICRGHGLGTKTAFVRETPRARVIFSAFFSVHFDMQMVQELTASPTDVLSLRAKRDTHRPARTIHIPGQSERRELDCLSKCEKWWVSSTWTSLRPPPPPTHHTHFILFSGLWHFSSRAPHNDVSVNDGPHIQRWSHNIII